MDVSGAGGASATTRAAAEFARSANLKVGGANAGKTRTQALIEQMNAEAVSKMRSGSISPLLGGGVLAELTKIQARRR